MDGLLLLQKKLEDVLSLIKSFGQEDLVKAGKVWNNFSLQLQSIINLDLDLDEDSAHLNRKTGAVSKLKRNLKNCNNLQKTKLRKSSTGESTEEISTIISPPSKKQSLKDSPLIIISTNKDSFSEDKEQETNANNSDLQKEVATLSVIVDKEQEPEQENKNEETTFTSKSQEKAIIAEVEPEKVCAEVGPVLPSRLKSKQFICDECGAAFSTKGNFNVHLRKHSGDKPFPCSKCSKRFNTSSNLRRHLLSHQGVKPYHCSMCDARFTERKSLVNHVRRHTKETPFECTICGKAYRTRWVHSQHVKTHGGDAGKAHLCHQCGKSFTQKSQLKLHEKRIHLCVKPNICSFCDMPFTTKSDLRRHEITHSGRKAKTNKKLKDINNSLENDQTPQKSKSSEIDLEINSQSKTKIVT